MLKINEFFETIQGEGFYTGLPSVFLRLQGCPVGCAWCDTKHTWEVDPSKSIDFSSVVNKKEENDLWVEYSEQELVNYLLDNYSAKHVVITGGEPCIYDLTDLTERLQKEGYSCQIETSGTFEILATDDTWVTVSPKVDMRGGLKISSQAMARANELKHPVGTDKDIDNLKALLNSFDVRENVIVSLQPISQKKRATELCIQTCIDNNWRLSIQTHKYLNIA
ncbi:7-carboxy-7-deazaguanine synthase QueE [Vibrio sp. UCD-FRSSP16_10]|uniref:7-carboxy-7-deazaguanine synthase QueE n=1 Tax=unclassified Vibrio TaxID=2614977 RepID=UPI0007FCF181|nr:MULTISPECIES: 7-carboxy-7-deazaguanine synthase QueE [unclassified Vibrio]OBT13535.1 7-carboxy-7-deazaguanine synthase QueE [Vibrio sp. UCD-FRSSP16_30]OBT19994.1 7-carboxy-7-deazaguanine synthase QueE [Vibrio sp. UCD-FRSSP16_10]